jgi:hypothetical protein
MERQVVALAKSEQWHDRVQLQVYYLDDDPALKEKYAPIAVGAAVINQKHKLPRVTIPILTEALEQSGRELGEQGIEKF